MDHSSPTPSTVQIIRNDYLAFFTTIVPPALWLLFIVIYIMPDALNGQPVHLPIDRLLILAVLTLIFAALLAWRVIDLRALFAEGARVDGTITRLRFLGDGGWITYRYTFQGEPYEIRRRLIKTERSLRLKNGAAVRVVVDPGEPRRSFIEQLFL